MTQNYFARVVPLAVPELDVPCVRVARLLSGSSSSSNDGISAKSDTSSSITARSPMGTRMIPQNHFFSFFCFSASIYRKNLTGFLTTLKLSQFANLEIIILNFAHFIPYFALSIKKAKLDMGANLVIVESPAKAKTINKFLGDDYTVKASFGHVRDLPADKLSIDVKGSFEPKYIVPADKEKVIKDLSAAAAKADTVWLASDEDREGEAIAWHLADTLKLDPASTRRIVFHEITKNAILNAVENPRDIDMNLVKAQQARRVLDRLVGYELSPVLWKKLKGGLSAGRVQSVAVRLIVDREREINAFTSQGFYRVEADFRTEEGATLKATRDHRFATEAEARAFLEKCAQADFSISGIDRKEMFRSPAAPFTIHTVHTAGKLLYLQYGIEDKHLKLKLTDEAKKYLIENGYDQVYGARPLKRFVQKKLETLIARSILSEQIKPNSEIVVDCKENKLFIS